MVSQFYMSASIPWQFPTSGCISPMPLASGCAFSGVLFGLNQPQTSATFETFTTAKCYQCGKFFRAPDFGTAQCPHCGADGDI